MSSDHHNSQHALITSWVEQLQVFEGVAQGGWGVVVQVSHPTSHTAYAMKVIPKDRLRKVCDKRHLDNELLVMGRLPSHPFTQGLLVAFQTPSEVCIVNELCRGGDLFYHLNRHTQTSGAGHGFAESTVQMMMAELVCAVCHLHDHEVVHCDIKIENIVIAASGHLKLIDYGMARPLLGQQYIKRGGSLIYMAPELITEGLCGRFTDWWAVGIVLFELLSGRSPWSSVNAQADRELITQEILSAGVPLVTRVSREAQQLLLGLTDANYDTRLGSHDSAIVHEVMLDSFFDGVDFEQVADMRYPAIVHIPDRGFFDEAASREAMETYTNLTSHQSNEAAGFDVGGLPLVRLPGAIPPSNHTQQVPGGLNLL